jgi:hypothetical protein
MTTMATKTEVKRWMSEHAVDHVEPATGIVNTTSLAEEAADAFDLYGNHNLYPIPEHVFEWSAEVAADVERTSR